MRERQMNLATACDHHNVTRRDLLRRANIPALMNEVRIAEVKRGPVILLAHPDIGVLEADEVQRVFHARMFARSILSVKC